MEHDLKISPVALPSPCVDGNVNQTTIWSVNYVIEPLDYGILSCCEIQDLVSIRKDELRDQWMRLRVPETSNRLIRFHSIDGIVHGVLSRDGRDVSM